MSDDAIQEESPTFYVMFKFRLEEPAWSGMKTDVLQGDRSGEIELWAHPHPERMLEVLRPWPDAWKAFVREIVATASRRNGDDGYPGTIVEFVLASKDDLALVRQLARHKSEAGSKVGA